MEQRTVVVFGATARLGREVVRALAGAGATVRAVSRHPDGPVAAALAALPGVEVAQGDVFEPAGLDALLAGADAVFLDFHVDFDDADFPRRAERMAEALVDAMARAEVRHVVFHTALSPLRTLGIPARHWDARAEVEVRLRQSGLPVTFLMLPLPFDAFLDFLVPERAGKDHYLVALPIGMIAIDLIGLADVGEPVRQIFANPKRFRNKTIALSAGKMTAKNICEALSQHFSPIRFTDRQITHQEFRTLKFKGSVDWSHALEFLVRTDQQYSKDVTEKLNPNTRSLSMWLRDNHDDFLTALGIKCPAY